MQRKSKSSPKSSMRRRPVKADLAELRKEIAALRAMCTEILAHVRTVATWRNSERDGRWGPNL